jgi:hypothetical protein
MFFICTAAGGGLQFLAKAYLKRHTEFLKDDAP